MFGQISPAQGILCKRNVGQGDLFLFFGTFCEVDINFKYLPDAMPKHVIYGYLEIGDVINDPVEINKYTWHPHSKMTDKNSNTLYVAAKKLSFNHNFPGADVFKYRNDLVLTKGNVKWYIWDENRFPFLKQKYLYNSCREYNPSDGGIKIADRTGQEFVYNESVALNNWVKELIR